MAAAGTSKAGKRSGLRFLSDPPLCLALTFGVDLGQHNVGRGGQRISVSSRQKGPGRHFPFKR